MEARIAPWSKIPIIRLLVPLIAGIILQWYVPVDTKVLIIATVLMVILLIMYSLLPVNARFRLRFWNGTGIQFLLIIAGTFLTWKNLTSQKLLEEQNSTGISVYQAVITEPPVEKPNSIKIIATISFVKSAGTEKTLLYLQKSHKATSLAYGSVLLFSKPIEQVKNSGNPGSFDYKRYCLFNGISYQCYLRDEEYVISKTKRVRGFTNFIYSCTGWVIEVIKKYIPPGKEQGLAEALLIGYKNDLDKDLIQAYSNTGVIHVIAISGLHLGLIYGILVFLTRPIKKMKKLAWIRFILVISGLWIFSIMAGAQPSVLRSAVMFTCLAFSEVLSRKTSIYNSLAFSALIVLCYNPFWLWDAGFQLSYAAVISIITFYKPLYNCLYFKNKMIDLIWQLSAVTLSAQLLTLPVSIYHFHQFPLLFYFTNIVAVPVSSMILIGEVLLCTVSFLPPAAFILGDVLHWLIQFMNKYVERFSAVDIAVLDHLNISFLQSVLLTVMILCLYFWLMSGSKKILWASCLSLLFFLCLRNYSFYKTGKQKKIIVYNISKKKAIEIINGHETNFMGDAEVVKNKTLYNFNLYPSHVQYRLNPVSQVKPLQSFIIKNYRFTVADGQLNARNNHYSNIIIVSGKKRLEIKPIVSVLQPALVVLDATVPAWKSKKIKSELDSLQVNHHDVVEKGPFLMNL